MSRAPYKGSVTTGLIDLAVDASVWMGAADHADSAKIMSGLQTVTKRSPHLVGRKFRTELWTAVRGAEVEYLVKVTREV